MFKFNKSTHITIISTFAIVFIVIYLYYTITDLRKLQIEVSKLSKQVQELNNSQQQCPLPQATMTFVPGTTSDHMTVPSAPLQSIIEEDTSSVSTDEIKQLLDQQEAEEEAATHIVDEPQDVVEAPIETSAVDTDVVTEETTVDTTTATTVSKQPRIRKITKKTT